MLIVHEAYVGEISVCAGFWWVKLMEGHHSEYTRIHEIITLKWILKQYDGKPWT